MAGQTANLPLTTSPHRKPHGGKGDLGSSHIDLSYGASRRPVTGPARGRPGPGTRPAILGPPQARALSPRCARWLAGWLRPSPKIPGFAAEFAEFAEDGIASNALWPRTLIATAAVQNLLGGDEAMAHARRPELYADAAYAVVTKPSRDCTGNAFLCEDVLAEEGVTDFDRYAYLPDVEPQVDMFVDHA